MAFRLKIEPRNAQGKPIRARREVKIGSSTWRMLTESEKRDGIELNAGDTLVVRASKIGLWQLEQGLSVTSSSIDYSYPHDLKDHLHLKYEHVKLGVKYYTLRMWLTLFRNAYHDLVYPPSDNARWRGKRWEKLEENHHTLVSFRSTRTLPYVLDVEGSRGFGRFYSTIITTSQYSNHGFVLFLKSPKHNNMPELVAVFVPGGLNAAQDIPVHTFFMPSTVHKPGEYPYGKTFQQTFNTYLAKERMLLSQLISSHKQGLFVLPMPPKTGHLKALQHAKHLYNYLYEILRFCFGDPVSFGSCSLSSFSSGGSFLLGVMKTKMYNHDNFKELKELYSLDSEWSSTREISLRSKHWLDSDPEHRLRIYVTSEYARGHKPTFRASYTRSSAGAIEYGNSAQTGTYVFAPVEFWSTVAVEDRNRTPAPSYYRYHLGKTKDGTHLVRPTWVVENGRLKLKVGDWNHVHWTAVSVFLEHALKVSGFANV